MARFSIKQKDKPVTAGQKKRSRRGGYSAALVATVVVLVIGVNLLLTELPSSVRKLDFSGVGRFGISSQTKALVSALTLPVDIYVIAQEGSEEQLTKEILERYDDLSDNLTVSYIDPVKMPNFASQYTNSQVTNNSVIVASEKRSRYIPYSEILKTVQSVDASGQQASSVIFDGESQFTSAIDFVVSDTLPVMYTLNGHAETELSETFENLVKQANIENRALNLLTTGKVPDDAAGLLINAPERDLSKEEADMVINYLNVGGSLLLVTQISAEEMPNLNRVMEHYGLSLVEGIVTEGDPNYCYYNYATYLLPEKAAHEITNSLIEERAYIMAPIAQGILAEELEGVAQNPLLQTSRSAYSKVDVIGAETMEKEPGDIDGPFVVGMAASAIGPAGESRAVLYTTPMIFNAEIDQTVSGGNAELFINSLGWLMQTENSISIQSKDIGVMPLMMSQGTASRINLIITVAIPLLIVALGFILWMRRRKR